MRPRRIRFWLALSLFPLGCKQPPDLSADLTEYADLVNESYGLICMCPQEAGFDTIEECSDAMGRIDYTESECQAAALEGYEEEGKDYLDCVNAAYMDYASCLSANVNCDGGALDNCRAAHSNALNNACPQLPDGARQAFAACSVD